MTALCVIFGDQLSWDIAALADADPTQTVVCMAEVWDEATYVKHHKKKLAFLFSAMRHFANALRSAGYTVAYTPLDDPKNTGSFRGEVQRAMRQYGCDHIVVTHPGEYRVMVEVQAWAQALDVSVDIREDTRFLCTLGAFDQWASGRKQLRMEYFYREMRKQYAILMAGDQPVGGKWNYDADNRKPLKSGVQIPLPWQTKPDAITQSVMAMVAERFSDHFGDIDPMYLAVTHDQAQAVLDDFIAHRLPYFGDYQDAMIQGEPWLYHSHIGFYLNCGLLCPLPCVTAAVDAYNRGDAPLNAVEGFIRQIMGWREYVRGIYWRMMPDYAQNNALGATRPLPDFYWTGKTGMNCIAQCVQETKRNAYAHHIQRLMVLGNFALLAGLDPKAVNNWFLIVYADAYEWVELPNVTGMILFADGGYLASKPYAAGGSYIHKMSNYCQQCRYKVAEKTGPDACPFNYLYWDFLARNRDYLKGNPRVGMMYKTYDRMTDEKKAAIQSDATRFLQTINPNDSST